MDELAGSISDTGLTCPKCGYNLTAVSGNCCPECGVRFRIEEGAAPPTLDQRRRERNESIIAMVIGGSAVVVLFAVGGRTLPVIGVIGYAIAMTLLIARFGLPYVLMTRFERRANAVSTDRPVGVADLPMVVEVRSSPEVLLQYYRRTLLPRFRTSVIGLLFCASLIGALLLTLGDHWLLYVGLGAVSAFLFSMWSQFQVVWHKPIEATTLRFTISEEGMSYSDEDGTVLRRWNAVNRIDKHPDMWIVHFRSGTDWPHPTEVTPPEVFAVIESKTGGVV